ncbi:MAG TPA: hypothetical protein VM184_06360 [Gaiellaceae bacterium]|nr:hypothetical protein [Gaiellaceae bacterium]
MTTIKTKSVLVAALSMLAVLSIGAATAGAHGGPGQRGFSRITVSKLVTEAAKQLGVSRATLVTAIRSAAVARIDEAVEDEDIDADETAELKEEVQDNLSFAYSLSRASEVASNLDVTTAKLNTGFRDGRRAIYLARIEAAQEDGEIDADEAAELKEELEDADLPGYKAFRGFGFRFGGFADRHFKGRP